MRRRLHRLREFLTARAVVEAIDRLPDVEASGQRVPGVPPEELERELPSSPRAERAVLVALLVAVLGAVAFIVFYIVIPDTQLLGGAMGAALLALAVAAVIAGKGIVPQETAVEEREDFGDPELQEEVVGIVERGGEGVSRRGVLLGAAGVAGVSVAAAAAIPAASLGPDASPRLGLSPWSRGRRVVDGDGRPLTVDDVDIGTFRTGYPEGASRGKLGSPILLVRLEEDEIEMPPERRAGVVAGVVAYSKICPHAGCAVSMYRHPLYEPTEPQPALVCPCHYSTFDVRRGGELLFGPAGRDLPQLPLMANAAGELFAAGGFYDAIGPSWGQIRMIEDPD